MNGVAKSNESVLFWLAFQLGFKWISGTIYQRKITSLLNKKDIDSLPIAIMKSHELVPS